MKKILLIMLFVFISLNANKNFIIKDKKGERITLVKSDFKILEFNKKINDILVSDSKKTEVFFVKDDIKPLQTIKIFAKELGYSKLLITFDDKSTLLHEISIIQNFSKLIEIIKVTNKDVSIHQANGKVILKGYVKDTKEKLKIEGLFEKAGVNKQDLINLLEVRKPNKMIRIKLYVTEINNNDGYDIKNNWALGYKNYTRSYASDKEAAAINSFIPSLANSMDSAVTLTGGLAAGANYLGSNFNTGLTLNYLASKGVATVLDETELITLENKKSVFHAGGKIYVKMQTTSAEGLPSTDLKEIDYGLKLEVKVNNIINNEYVDLTITTRQDKINWTNQVDGIPSFTNQAINTFVIIKDKSTIVLGGLVNKNDAKNHWKIPVLGDMPVLGPLFKSKNFQSGKSELVFFIIPEIVDPAKTADIGRLSNTKSVIKELSVKNKEFKEKQNGLTKNVKQNPKRELTNEELHQQRIKEMFGI